MNPDFILPFIEKYFNYYALNTQFSSLEIFFLSFSSARFVTGEIMKIYSCFVMVVIKVAMFIVINPRSPSYLTGTGFVPFV